MSSNTTIASSGRSITVDLSQQVGLALDSKSLHNASLSRSWKTEEQISATIRDSIAVVEALS